MTVADAVATALEVATALDYLHHAAATFLLAHGNVSPLELFVADGGSIRLGHPRRLPWFRPEAGDDAEECLRAVYRCPRCSIRSEEPTERCDVWGLAMTLLAFVNGKPAFVRDDLSQTMRAWLHDDLPGDLMAGLGADDALAGIVRAALNRVCDDRPSLDEFVAVLRIR